MEFIIERPGKTERCCCRVRFHRFYISFILLSSSLFVISPMVNLALSDSFFFSSSILYGGIRRSWCALRSAFCASPIVIFPLGRLKSSHPSPSSLRLSYFQIRARTTTRLYGSIAPATSISVVYFVRWHMHSMGTSTRNNYVSQPLADSILSLWFGRCLGMSAFWEKLWLYLCSALKLIPSVVMKPLSGSWIPTPYFPIVQAEQNGRSIARSTVGASSKYYQVIATAFMQFQNLLCTSDRGT